MSCVCPVCSYELCPAGDTIFVADIFERWKTVHAFKPEVLQEHLHQSPVTHLYRCPNCLLEIYLPSVIGTESFYKELQDDMTVSYYREDKWDFGEALKEVQICETIMEIGCGPGSFLAEAKPRVKKACGTEFNESALQVARSRGVEVYGLEADMTDLKGVFDAVFSFHVLEHVQDPIGFVREISAFVKPGGMVCISVPNQAGPMKNIPNSLMNMPPHHATHWQLKTFRALADRLKFRIVRVAYEPLLLENHSYYSYFWLNNRIQGATVAHRMLKQILSTSMHWFFTTLMKFKFRYFSPLRGQAIYVVMKKQEA